MIPLTKASEPSGSPHAMRTIPNRGIYRQKVVEAYNHLDLSGFGRLGLSLADVPLEDIFVHLTLTVEKRTISSEQGKEQVLVVQEPVTLEQALKKHLLIAGEPGAGKSTLLRWLAVTFAQGRQREDNRLGPSADPDRLPVVIELGRLPDRYLKSEGGETPNWLRFLPEYITDQLSFADIPRKLLAQALTDGRCLLLFDGLDEVAHRQARHRLASALDQLARFSSGNRIVIGSRPAGVNAIEGILGSQFQRCQIERFTSEDVQRFFAFGYAQLRRPTLQQQGDVADAIIQANPRILELAQTPLLCTLLLLIWINKGTIPQRRVELYEQCCRTFIEDWEPHHGVDYLDELAQLGWERHLKLLESVAYRIHEKGQRTSVSGEEVRQALAEGLVWIKECTQEVADSKAEQYLRLVGLRSGLLQDLGSDQYGARQYGFPHLTFQEYLAARYIAAQPDPEYIDLVMTHLHEAWWREVHLLTIGYLGSKSQGANRVSALLLKILHVYAPPRPSPQFLRSLDKISSKFQDFFYKLLLPICAVVLTVYSINSFWPDMLQPAFLVFACIVFIITIFIPLDKRRKFISLDKIRKFIPLDKIRKFISQIQSKRRMAWVLAREFVFVVRGYAECTAEGATPVIDRALLSRAASLAQYILSDDRLLGKQMWLLTVAYRILHRRENETVVSALTEALRDADSNVLQRAVGSGDYYGSGMSVSEVKDTLRTLYNVHSNERLREAARQGKEGWNSNDEADDAVVVRAYVETLLHSVDGQERRKAAARLGWIRADNDVAVNVLHDTGNDVAVNALHNTNKEGRLFTVKFTLTEAFLGSTGQLMEVARLGRIRADKEAVAYALIDALHDTDKEVRLSALFSLERVGVSNEAVAHALIDALRSADGDLQLEAARALGHIGVDNEMMVQALSEALHNRNASVREEVVKSLRHIGVDNEMIVQTLLEALHDGNASVREEAVGSLRERWIDREEVKNALLEALHDTSREVRSSAASKLAWVGISNEAVVKVLLEDLHLSFSTHSQREIAQMLGRLGTNNEAAVQVILEVLHDPKSQLQDAAALSLGWVKVKDDAAVKRALQDALHNPKHQVRSSAAVSLAQLPEQTKEVVSTLVEALYNADSRRIRGYVTIILGQLEIKDSIHLSKVLIALSGCLGDDEPSSDVDKSALTSLRQLLDGRPFPGYRWMLLSKQRERKRRIWRSNTSSTQFLRP